MRYVNRGIGICISTLFNLIYVLNNGKIYPLRPFLKNGCKRLRKNSA